MLAPRPLGQGQNVLDIGARRVRARTSRLGLEWYALSRTVSVSDALARAKDGRSISCECSVSVEIYEADVRISEGLVTSVLSPESTTFAFSLYQVHRSALCFSLAP